MGRPKLATKRKVGLLLPEDLLAEMFLLKPELQTPEATTRHGALSSYFTALLQKDLTELKARIHQNAQKREIWTEEAI